jgi:hypothetical protein
MLLPGNIVYHFQRRKLIFPLCKCVAFEEANARRINGTATQHTLVGFARCVEPKVIPPKAQGNNGRCEMRSRMGRILETTA